MKLNKKKSCQSKPMRRHFLLLAMLWPLLHQHYTCSSTCNHG